MKRVGVVGWPVGHSRSPVIFGHWFRRYGIEATYERIPVAPQDADAFFFTLPREWHGVNVTVPHKEVAAHYANVAPDLRPLGSVNTLWRREDEVRGTSSDGPGFRMSLEAADPAWFEATFGPVDNHLPAERDPLVVILGAGGAAVAIAARMARETRRIIVANRTLPRAQALATRVIGMPLSAGTTVTPVALSALAPHLERASLLVNATTLGMEGQPPLAVSVGPLPVDAAVVDIVYTPLVTPPLAAAEARGLRTVDGLGMLLHQATVGFERWFGIAPEVDGDLRAAVAATL